MTEAINWLAVARADRVDKRARLMFLDREAPGYGPYTNLMSPTIKPTKEDYAEAARWYDNAMTDTPLSRQIRKRFQDAADKAVLEALHGGATIATASSEPLTLDSLKRMMATLPKRETFLSSRLFPNDRALQVEGGSEKFTVAGPGFWTRLRIELDKLPKTSSPTANPVFTFNIEPIEIDPWPDDGEELAKWRAGHWDRLREAFEVAMQPLPEWLRAPPKFSKHG